MTGMLFKKECRQHGIWFILLAVTTPLLLRFVSAAVNASGGGGGVMAGLGTGFRVVLPIMIWILAFLLIAVEFRQKTQLFLEGLPLPRWRMIAVKCGLGIVLSIIYAAGSVLFCWITSGGTEAVTMQFLQIMLATAAAWSAFLCSFFIVAGFLGRYRLAVCFVIFIVMISLANRGVPMGEFPPFALLERFGLEREIWPKTDLVCTWAITAGLLGLSFTMGLTKEGSVAAMMGEKMSYREKITIGGALFLFMTFMGNFTSPAPEPFELPGAVAEEIDGIQLFLSPENVARAVDQDVAFASKLAAKVGGIRDWLAISDTHFPPIYIVERTDLEDGEVIGEDVDVEAGRVVLAFANYLDDSVSLDSVASKIMLEVLHVRSIDRIKKEDRWWIAMGLQQWLEFKNASSEELAEQEKRVGEIVSEHGFSPENVTDWKAYEELVGEDEVPAIAWTVVLKFVDEYGEEALQNLAQNTVARYAAGKDNRASIYDFFHPISKAFRKATGGDTVADFSEKWAANIEGSAQTK